MTPYQTPHYPVHFNCPANNKNTGKRDSIHHHLLEAIPETANVLELRQKLLYTTPSGWWLCIESVFRNTIGDAQQSLARLMWNFRLFAAWCPPHGFRVQMLSHSQLGRASNSPCQVSSERTTVKRTNNGSENTPPGCRCRHKYIKLVYQYGNGW